MRVQFCNEAIRMHSRILKAKIDGQYNPKKKYYRWKLFDELKFVASGRSRVAFIDLSFVNNPPVDIKVDEHEAADQVQTHLLDSNSGYTDSDVEFIESDDNSKSNQAQSSQEIYLQKEMSTIRVDSSEPEYTNFKSYTVDLNSCLEGSEYRVNLNDKQEPEFHIEVEKQSIESEKVTESQSGRSTMLKAHTQSFQEELNASAPPNLNDEDYSFLYSFLSQTKAMTQLQRSKFRENMKNLLQNIFPSSVSLIILEKQLLLPHHNDPDRKFLISFWPFISSMSAMQNLQFRAKMTDLALEILLSEAVS